MDNRQRKKLKIISPVTLPSTSPEVGLDLAFLFENEKPRKKSRVSL